MLDHLGVGSSSYNYYPRTMIRLCEISYEDMYKIPNEVKALGWTVVWGPEELTDSIGISYSRMFVAMRPKPQEYVVVIRGTNFDSWQSWTKQDFKVGKTKPFNLLAPHAPANALISEGTYNGMRDLISLSDSQHDGPVTNFLAKVKPQYLYVTGHSLGGTLTPPMFAYLNDILFGGTPRNSMALWSFAGLTPGDGGFNTYFNSLGNPQFPFRIHNSLDIAPFMFYSFDSIEQIYWGHNLHWDFAEKDFVKDLFDKAKGKGYAQPLGDQKLTGVFDTSFPARDIWAEQALHQHHSTTYRKLVDAFYP